MSTVNGVVEAVSTSGKSILVEGNWYGSKYPIKFPKGSTVTIETDPSGKFIKKISGEAGAPAPSDSGGAKKTWGKGGDFPRGKFPIDPADGQRSIIRQNALTNARELALTLLEQDKMEYEDTDSFVTQVIKIAYKFEKYTAGDYEREAAEKRRHEPKTFES